MWYFYVFKAIEIDNMEINEQPEQPAENFDFSQLENFLSYEPLNEEETLATATALAQRISDEENLTKKTIAELGGDDLTGTPEEDLATLQNRTATIMVALENPYAEIDQSEALKVIYSESTIRKMNEDGDFTDQEIEGFLKNLPREHNQQGGGADNLTTNLKAARKVAEENNASVADVYSRDELYSKLMRNTNELGDYADKCISGLSDDSSKDQILVNFIDNLVIGETEQPSSDAINEMVFELQMDENLSATILEAHETSQEALRQLYSYQIMRYWGDDAFDQLTREQKERLTPQRSIAPSILERIARF